MAGEGRFDLQGDVARLAGRAEYVTTEQPRASGGRYGPPDQGRCAGEAPLILAIALAALGFPLGVLVGFLDWG